MQSADRGQYEVLKDDDVSVTPGPSGVLQSNTLRLDETHNLDAFFSNIYQYHQSGGFAVVFTCCVLTALKFAFLFFCIIELTVCMKWDKLMNSSAVISDWNDVISPPAVCWARLPPLATICLAVAVIVFAAHLVRSSIFLMQVWGVRRFCSMVLDLPTGDAELADITWSEVLHRLLSCQDQMRLSPSKPLLDELDIYNRILRRTNYLIGMINREAIPFRFRVPKCLFPSHHYIYLPDFYLLNLNYLLFWGPKCPFVTYWKLRPEYKWLTKRQELADELATQSRLAGLVGLCLSPFVLLVQLLLFMCSNSKRLRYEPASLFGRRWSNYAHYYLRHFNELHHEFVVRLNQAYLPAQQYLDCFPSRLLNVIADNVVFCIGGVSLLLFAASLVREQLLHLPGFLAVLAIGGVLTKVCASLLPDEQAVHFPRARLIETLSRIHYMPDHWKEHAHTHQVRYEFSELFQLRIVGVLEELVSPILTPLILLFYLPNHCLEIVDFLRNFTVEIAGVGDICSFAQLDIQRHGHPDWSPHFDDDDDDAHDDGAGSPRHHKQQAYGSPALSPQQPSPPSSHDDEDSYRHMPSFGGKIELSLMHFHITNPGWNLPPDSRAYLAAVRKQALNDIQRYQQEQVDLMLGMQSSVEHLQTSLERPLATQAVSPQTLSLYRSLYTTTPVAGGQGKFPETGPVYSSDFSTHVKNVAYLSGPAVMSAETLGVRGALVESMYGGVEAPPSAASSPGQQSPSRPTAPTTVSQGDRQHKGVKPSGSSKATDGRLPEAPQPVTATGPTSHMSSSVLNSPRLLFPFHAGGVTPSASLMGASGLYSAAALQLPYQPYTSQMEDRAFLNSTLLSPSFGTSICLHPGATRGSATGMTELTADMDASSLYIHELHQRRRQQKLVQTPSPSSFAASVASQSYLRPLRHIGGPHRGDDNHAAGGASSASRNQGWEPATVRNLDAPELRYQQPGGSSARASHYIGPAGRGRSLFHASVVSRPGADPRRQFEEVAEDPEEDADAVQHHQSRQRPAPTPTPPLVPPSSTSGETTTRGLSQVAPPPPLAFEIPEAGDDVPIWPDLPPPTC
nr:unnamed protein product [Spirometra erinaceieuropaei]